MNEPKKDARFVWRCRMIGGIGLLLTTILLYAATSHLDAFNYYYAGPFPLVVYTLIFGAIHGRATGLALALVRQNELADTGKCCLLACAKSIPLYILLPFIYQGRTSDTLDPASLVAGAWGLLLLVFGAVLAIP